MGNDFSHQTTCSKTGIWQWPMELHTLSSNNNNSSCLHYVNRLVCMLFMWSASYLNSLSCFKRICLLLYVLHNSHGNYIGQLLLKFIDTGVQPDWAKQSGCPVYEQEELSKQTGQLHCASPKCPWPQKKSQWRC